MNSYCKYLALVTAVIFSHSSFAALQTCKHEAGDTPYKTIKIDYALDADGNLDSKKNPVVTVYENRKTTIMKNTSLKKHEFRGGNGPRIDYILSFDDGNDWFDTTVYLDEADEVVTAYVDFVSDGPSAKGFYKCDEFPFKRDQ